jgi:hypothetical protein
MSNENGLLGYADRELRAAGYSPEAEEPLNWLYENTMELLNVLAKQGHSGTSVHYVRTLFSTLSDYKPLGPLTGKDSEWIDHGEGFFQNNRCYHVFKDPDGSVYDATGRVFREPSGACYTNVDSRVPVTFPYTPKVEYVDVPEFKESEA